jgi:hypothetical protein
MRNWKTNSAVLGLGLVLAASGAQAGLIPSGYMQGPDFGRWNVPARHDGHGYWAFHRPARQAYGLDLRALLDQYSRRTHSLVPQAAHVGRLDEDYASAPGLCGGAPGAGLADGGPADTVQGGNEEEESEPEDESGTELAAEDPGRLPASRLPTVPEPGSMAMLGAGALGLLAARAVLKKR